MQTHCTAVVSFFKSASKGSMKLTGRSDTRNTSIAVQFSIRFYLKDYTNKLPTGSTPVIGAPYVRYEPDYIGSSIRI